VRTAAKRSIDLASIAFFLFTRRLTRLREAASGLTGEGSAMLSSCIGHSYVPACVFCGDVSCGRRPFFFLILIDFLLAERFNRLTGDGGCGLDISPPAE
jgi:hypothetical protein